MPLIDHPPSTWAALDLRTSAERVRELTEAPSTVIRAGRMPPDVLRIIGSRYEDGARAERRGMLLRALDLSTRDFPDAAECGVSPDRGRSGADLLWLGRQTIAHADPSAFGRYAHTIVRYAQIKAAFVQHALAMAYADSKPGSFQHCLLGLHAASTDGIRPEYFREAVSLLRNEDDLETLVARTGTLCQIACFSARPDRYAAVLTHVRSLDKRELSQYAAFSAMQMVPPGAPAHATAVWKVATHGWPSAAERETHLLLARRNRFDQDFSEAQIMTALAFDAEIGSRMQGAPARIAFATGMAEYFDRLPIEKRITLVPALRPMIDNFDDFEMRSTFIHKLTGQHEPESAALIRLRADLSLLLPDEAERIAAMNIHVGAIKSYVDSAMYRAGVRAAEAVGSDGLFATVASRTPRAVVLQNRALTEATINRICAHGFSNAAFGAYMKLANTENAIATQIELHNLFHQLPDDAQRSVAFALMAQGATEFDAIPAACNSHWAWYGMLQDLVAAFRTQRGAVTAIAQLGRHRPAAELGRSYADLRTLAERLPTARAKNDAIAWIYRHIRADDAEHAKNALLDEICRVEPEYERLQAMRIVLHSQSQHVIRPAQARFIDEIEQFTNDDRRAALLYHIGRNPEAVFSDGPVESILAIARQHVGVQSRASLIERLADSYANDEHAVGVLFKEMQRLTLPASRMQCIGALAGTDVMMHNPELRQMLYAEARNFKDAGDREHARMLIASPNASTNPPPADGLPYGDEF